MASGTLDYKLVIRDATNASDELVFTTIPGQSPYTLMPPKGDGQSFDPISGTFVIGAYTYSVIDADVGGGLRAVSSNMANTDGRYKLVSRIALVYFSANRGTSWVAYTSGFVNRVRKTSALLYEFTVGDAQRIEKAITLFAQKSGSFDKMSCLLGGPVRGGFGPIADYGPWTVITKAFYAGIVVQFHFVSGYVRRSTSTLFMNFPTGGFQYVEGDYTGYEEQKVNALADPYRVGTPDFKPAGVGFKYPRLEARVEDMNGALIGLFQVLNGRDPAYTTGGGWSAGDMHAILSGGDLCLDWATSGINANTGTTYPAQPALHANVRVIVYALDVTDTTPVHLSGHPIELCTLAYDDALIAYDAGSVSQATDDIGAAKQIALRPTKSMKLDAFITLMSGFFGFSIRQQNGVRFFFATRIRVSATPARTLTANDLSDAMGVIFDLDEKTITNKVTVSLEHYDLYAPEKFGQDDKARPVDEIVTTPQTFSVSAPVTDAADGTVHETTFSIQGELFELQSPGDLFGHTFGFLNSYPVELSAQDFVLAMASGAGSILDRRQRGSIVGELRCVRGSPGDMDNAVLGEEIYCLVPWQQNKNGIGGNRILQITKRTENPGGPVFAVEDSGTDAQPATLPTFTGAKDTTTDPKRYALITITNSSALLAEGDTVRIEWATAGFAPSFGLLAVITPDMLSAGRTVLRTPRMNAGQAIALQMRSELQGKRPSAYTFPVVTVSLDSLVPPTALLITAVPGDDTQVIVSWLGGETDVPIEIRFKVTGDTAWRTVVAAASSLNLLVGTLALTTTYNFDVRYHEKPPYVGVSSSITANFTTGSTERTLLPPDNPSAFSGSFDAATGAFVNDGTYGLEVTAVEFPESIAFEGAIEDAPGAGTYSAGFVELPRGVASAAQYPNRTRWTGLAPSDGLRRRLRAKATRVGAIDSAWCDPVDVLPYVPQQPVDFPVPVPVLTLSYQVILEAGAQRAVIVASWTEPTESQYNDMEYLLRAKVPGGVYGTFSRVPGTKSGPDLIPAQFGQIFEVTLVTITKQGVRNEGVTPDGVQTIEIPATAADGVLTATADVDSMNHVVTPNAAAAAYDVFSKTYASDPGTVDRVDDDIANYVPPRRDATLTYFELPVDAGANLVRVTTVVFYDQNGIEGDYQTVKATQDPSATPPTAPTIANQVNAANGVVERVTFVTTPAAGDQIPFYRGGSLLSTYTITSGDVTAGYADLTDATAVGGTSYSYTAKQHRLSDGLLSAMSTADSFTVASGGTLATPGTPTTGMDSGDPCASALVTPRDTTSNPSGTVYDIYGDTSSGGSFTTLLASNVAKNSAVSVTRPGGQHASSYFKAVAKHTGYTASAKGAAGSIGPVPSGTLC
jgi:hypothetical protein